MPDPKLPQNKQEAAFQRLLAKVPSRPASNLESQAEEDSAFRELEAKLSNRAKEALAKLSEEPTEISGDTQLRWCVCEAFEGEFSRVRIFKDLEGLCCYLGRLEGQEVSVWPFYGVAMRVTRPLTSLHERRILLLPGEHEAVVLPQTQLEPFQRLDASLLPDLETSDFQTNGWLGLPSLAEGEEEYSEGNEVIRQQKAASQPPEKPDEDDDPEHDQENPVPK